VLEQALDHAVALTGEEGVGAPSVSAVARRMGLRPTGREPAWQTTR
jgi:hypothetical protein